MCLHVIANGEVCNMSEVERVHQATGADGVMAARGMLENSAKDAGYDCTPVQCVQGRVSASQLDYMSPWQVVSDARVGTVRHNVLMYLLCDFPPKLHPIQMTLCVSPNYHDPEVCL